MVVVWLLSCVQFLWSLGPVSSVHGFSQARILDGLLFPSPGDFSQPRDQTRVSCIAGGFFNDWATWEAQIIWWWWYNTCDFPGGPVDKTPCFQCRGCGFDIWLGSKIPHAVWNCQKKKEKQKMMLIMARATFCPLPPALPVWISLFTLSLFQN